MFLVYFDQVPDASIYKRKWFTQIYNGISKFGNLLKRTDSIEKCNFIVCIPDNYYMLYKKHKLLIGTKNIKFILISCQDSSLEDHEYFKNENIALILDHCKNKYVKNSKITTLLNSNNRLEFIENTLLLKDREYDVMFLGKVYMGNEYQNHRIEVINKLEEFQKKYPQYKLRVGDSVRPNEYFHYLQNTKILVSPYGHGEWSLKDYEAVCNGIHVVKPDIYYECYPNYYEHMDHYGGNIGKLEETLLYILNHLEEIQEKVNKNRELFRGYSLCTQISTLEQIVSLRYSNK